jgi:hypothetical protein
MSGNQPTADQALLLAHCKRQLVLEPQGLETGLVDTHLHLLAADVPICARINLVGLEVDGEGSLARGVVCVERLSGAVRLPEDDQHLASFDGLHLSIPCLEGVVSREATGTEDEELKGYGDPSSNAEAMALKRTASKFGLGLYLYQK